MDCCLSGGGSSGQLPDYIASCQEDIRRQVENSVEKVRDQNEIVKGLKFTNTRRAKVIRWLREKLRLRPSKANSVVKHCEQLQQEYQTKWEELNTRIFGTADDSNDTASTQHADDTTGTDEDKINSSGDDEDAGELNSDTITEWYGEQLQQEYKSKWEELNTRIFGKADDSNDTASTQHAEDTTDTGEDEVTSSGDDEDAGELNSDTVTECMVKQKELKQEYIRKINDYLGEQLNVTFNMRDENVRRAELGDVIFYYLMTSPPGDNVQIIIYRLFDPLYDQRNQWNHHSFWELCSVVLFDVNAFTQFYERLDNNKTVLEYLLYIRPQLLLHNKSSNLMRRLIDHLPYDNIHQILTNFRESTGQGHMFFARSSDTYARLYMNHVDDMYELLTIRNINGQTALHTNTFWITTFLTNTYTPKQRHAFIKLTSMRDYKNQTAIQVADQSGREVLHSLIRRVENNEYVTATRRHTNILIIYNTNNREGAEEEAQTIYDACKSKYCGDNIVLEKNKSEDEIIDLVTQSANKRTFLGLPHSLIVILASHGIVGAIDDCDGNPIKLSDIEAAMCSDILDGRPKVLITDCCQFTEELIESCAYSPTHADFCAIMSCAAGEMSTRGVFFGKLSEEIINCKARTDIFKLVNNVSTMMGREGRKQTSVIMSTKKATLYPADMWYRWIWAQMYDQLQQPLNRTFQMSDEEAICQELGKLVFCLLTTGESTDVFQNQNIDPDEFCCELLGESKIFTPYSKQYKLTFKDIIFRRPQLLFRSNSFNIMNRLVELLPYRVVHQIMLITRDENGQTLMFYINPLHDSNNSNYFNNILYPLFYKINIKELYDFLSVRNYSGKTALHVNTDRIVSLLANTYTPQLASSLYMLLSIVDESKQTALYRMTGNITQLLAEINTIELERDLYQLLSKCDNNGQTALHVNTAHVAQLLINTYKQNLSDDLYELLSIQDNTGQTALYMDTGWLAHLLVKIHKDEFADDLYQLLSIRDNNGQTALHVNTDNVAELLATTYAPELAVYIYMLLSIQDQTGQTALYIDTEGIARLLVKIHKNEFADTLYQLLSIRDNNGQTALHVNTWWITTLLADTYIPKNQTAFVKLIEIEDHQNKTALESNSTGRYRLSSLESRVKNNKYVLKTSEGTNALIIYNSNKRQKAKEEAETIHKALNSIYLGGDVKLEKDKTAVEILELVKKAAENKGVPFKSLIVILASHGSKGTFLDHEDTPIGFEAIEKAMCSPILEGRPKMLIAQCCQGETEETDGKAYQPTNAHFCVIMSGVPGGKSQRGLLFEKLAEQSRNSKDNPDIFKLVNRVAAEMKKHNHSQTPMIMTTLKAGYCPKDNWDKYY